MSDSHQTILAHHFDDLEQQHEASTLGMWAFLATEIMFFGGALAAYAVYRWYYFEAFAAASALESWRIGAANTAVLLCSSFTVVLAVHAAQQGRNRRVILYILLTMLFGLIFMGVKAVEYTHLIQHHHAPFLSSFHFDPPQHADGARIFFSFYFALTGLHATHMIIGFGLFIWLIRLARKNRFSAEYSNPVEIVGLYWHFVDIVWIFLYPLFYLVDTIQ